MQCVLYICRQMVAVSTDIQKEKTNKYKYNDND